MHLFDSGHHKGLAWLKWKGEKPVAVNTGDISCEGVHFSNWRSTKPWWEGDFQEGWGVHEMGERNHG